VDLEKITDGKNVNLSWLIETITIAPIKKYFSIPSRAKKSLYSKNSLEELRWRNRLLQGLPRMKFVKAGSLD
jgi:hypothetical protein